MVVLESLHQRLKKRRKYSGTSDVGNMGDNYLACGGSMELCGVTIAPQRGAATGQPRAVEHSTRLVFSSLLRQVTG